MFIWMFRWNYKRKLRKRYELLKKQFNDGLIIKDAFEIWEQLILKAI